MANENIVTLNIQSYNQIKAENVRFQMFISRLMEYAELSSDYNRIAFDEEKVADLLHLVYPDMYKKKLSSLRAQQTKMSMHKLDWEKKKESEDKASVKTDIESKDL